jgi:hypothetical protein
MDVAVPFLDVKGFLKAASLVIAAQGQFQRGF